MKQETRQKTQSSIAYIEQAKEKAPCIVFIDEWDDVGKSRGGGVGGACLVKANRKHSD